jgi:hypothetical protein
LLPDGSDGVSSETGGRGGCGSVGRLASSESDSGSSLTGGQSGGELVVGGVFCRVALMGEPGVLNGFAVLFDGSELLAKSAELDRLDQVFDESELCRIGVLNRSIRLKLLREMAEFAESTTREITAFLDSLVCRLAALVGYLVLERPATTAVFGWVELGALTTVDESL